jgi:hypothetical protein
MSALPVAFAADERAGRLRAQLVMNKFFFETWPRHGPHSALVRGRTDRC